MFVQRNPKEVFKFIHMKQGTTRIPGKMHDEDITYESAEDIVNAFERVFSNKYCPSSDLSVNDIHSNLPSFKLIPVSEEELLKKMSTFPIKNTAGEDQIPSFLIHDTRFALIKPFVVIINKGISSSTFPVRWKRARIIPIHKKNEQSQLKNYRPIAILSNFAKIFEQVIYKSIFNNIQSYISPYQHGFISGRSTVTNLVTYNHCRIHN